MFAILRKNSYIIFYNLHQFEKNNFQLKNMFLMLYVGIILKLYYNLYWLLTNKERYFNKANLCGCVRFLYSNFMNYIVTLLVAWAYIYTENRLQKYSKLHSFATQFFHEPFTSMI